MHGGFLVLMCIALTFLPAEANAENDAAVVGVGTLTCSQYANEYRSDPKRAETIFMSWAQGYMSGQNMARGSAEKTVNLFIKPAQEQTRFLNSYCDQHPLVTFFQAAHGLYIDLGISSTLARPR